MNLNDSPLSLYQESKNGKSNNESIIIKEREYVSRRIGRYSKYDAVLQCGENGNMEILVFEVAHEDTYIPVRFPGCMDETDIGELLNCNDED